MKKKLSAVLMGLIIVAIGVIIIGNAAFGWGVNLWFKGWWALLLTVMFLFMIINDRPRFFNVMGLVIFGLLFAKNYIEMLDKVNVWLIVCGAAVLCVGGSIIYHAIFKPRQTGEAFSSTEGGAKADSGTCSFSNLTRDFHGKTFCGGDYTCSFGSLVIDLRGASVTPGSVLELNCSFGKIEVFVDRELKAAVNSDPFCGTVKCDIATAEIGSADLKIDTSCAFGAINISYNG